MSLLTSKATENVSLTFGNLRLHVGYCLEFLGVENGHSHSHSADWCLLYFKLQRASAPEGFRGALERSAVTLALAIR